MAYDESQNCEDCGTGSIGSCTEKGVVKCSIWLFCLLLAEIGKGTGLVAELESDKLMKGRRGAEIGGQKDITSTGFWPDRQ